MPAYRIFKPGLNKDSVINDPGKWQWYGVHNQNGRFRLSKTKVEFRRKKAGKVEVLSKETDTPMVVIASASTTFHESTIKGKRWQKSESFIFPGEHKKALKDYGRLKLTALGTVRKRGSAASASFHDYRIIAYAPLKGTRNTLEEKLIGPLTFSAESQPRVYWTGDLDHDQAPELLLVQEKTDKITYTFFKSAPAGKERLFEANAKGTWLK